jgi:alanine-glyoxylate transaminase/serine-glyoxylate transaminase/serine-pyruvate transaminase
VGAGLGELAGKQWRIGLMGASSSDVNINRCLRAFEAVLG